MISGCKVSKKYGENVFFLTFSMFYLTNSVKTGHTDGKIEHAIISYFAEFCSQI